MKPFSVYEKDSNKEYQGFFRLDQKGNLRMLDADGEWHLFNKPYRIFWNHDQ